MRRCLALLVFLVACQPFGEQEAMGVADEEVSTPPPTKPRTPPVLEGETSQESQPTMPAPVGCQGATFCDDFEGGPKGNGEWDGFAAIAGETIERVAGSAGPGSFSLGFLVPAGSAQRHTALRKELGNFGRIELSFAMKPPASFGVKGGHANIAHLDFGNDEVVLAVVGEGSRVGLAIADPRRPEFEGTNTRAVEPGVWHTIKVVVDLPGDPARARLEIDGHVVANETLANPFGAPPPARLVLGPDYRNSTSALDLRYDDVRVDASN